MPQMNVAGSWTKLRETAQMQSPHRKAPGPLAPRLESVGNKAMFLPGVLSNLDIWQL